MSESAKKKATYDDLYSIPENMTGEIINGELIVTPRPSPKHVYTTSTLGMKVGSRYQFGEGGGPGGWVILVEPEVRLGEETVVPDLAGWKKERYPRAVETNWISIPPDWACEVLSPGTMRTDKIKKMPLYGRHDVGYIWLIDPIAKTLEVFRLEARRWVVASVHAEDDRVRAEPFQEIEFSLNDIWLEGMT
jgi:Uma2 family endonuclease